MRRNFLAAVLLSSIALTAAPSVAAAQTVYPQTRRVALVETQFGVPVADPYRWLENDVRNDSEVRAWVDAENKVTNSFLATLPARKALQQRLAELLNYERYTSILKKGGRYFYARNSGLQNQSVLYVRDRLDGAERVLIDPNPWSKDGATALAEWQPNDQGTKLLYAVQDGGTDWRTLKVRDIASGKDTGDQIKWSKFSELTWAKDGRGFYYARYAEPAAGQQYQGSSRNQKIYFHKLGTAQSADRLIYATPNQPGLYHSTSLSEDGKRLVITSSETGIGYQVAVIDLGRLGARARILVPGFADNYSYVGSVGPVLYFATNKDAPKQKIVTIDASAKTPKLKTVVPESQATLEGADIIGGWIAARYMSDVKSEVRILTLGGSLVRNVDLPGIGAVLGFAGDNDDPETFFAFTSFNRPTTVYRYDVKSGEESVWAAPKVPFNPDDYSVEQRFYASKDGTRVPMFIVRKKGVTGPAPTLLYAYGGFDIAIPPSFSATRIAWLEKGGVYVSANIRGGSEYGRAWHDAGRLANKQNVFDDFIAAAEYLKANGIASPKGLAIDGASNGGLLIGAVVDQRPDLFDAAHPAVGVMDMLRFDRFTEGHSWVGDYGSPGKEADFRTLLAYSPYHNIKAGVHYPPILATTADTDDRVVPGHSFKYVAAMQAADPNGAPHLIRIETRAGHGSGKPIAKVIEETADVYAFLGHFTGLDPAR
ncbi:MAG: prolyl oligopeptidase [Sphingomonadales bacterium]|jgi:prolyl oligopeptidase|nr:prolyl oligopeptidase [Sphingomonadales bacterium]